VFPKSIPFSVHLFVETELNASLIFGGAWAGPFRNDELLSNGIPKTAILLI